MYFSRSFIAPALLGLATATTHAGESAMATAVMASESAASTAAAASATAVAGMVVTHVVQVGGPNGSIIFSPDNVKANPGDLVQFQFNAKNHSVVQSTFDQPCVPIQNVVSNSTSAFFSGYMPTNNTFGAKNNVLTYTVRVTDTKPIWYYCSQAKHCQGGMVGAINAAATGNKTMSAFKALAAQASENITPGQPAGQGSAPSGSGAAVPSATEAGTPGASSSSGASPAEQTTNAAPGMYDASRQSLFGLSMGAVAALFLL